METDPKYISPYSTHPERQTGVLEQFRDELKPQIAYVVERVQNTPEMAGMPISPDPISISVFDEEGVTADEEEPRSYDEFSPQEKDIATLLLLEQVGVKNIEDLGIGDEHKGIVVPVPTGPKVAVTGTRLYQSPTPGIFVEQDTYKNGDIGWSVVRADEEYLKGATS